jgi:hypothetical protein
MWESRIGDGDRGVAVMEPGNHGGGHEQNPDHNPDEKTEHVLSPYVFAVDGKASTLVSLRS